MSTQHRDLKRNTYSLQSASESRTMPSRRGYQPTEGVEVSAEPVAEPQELNTIV